MPDLGTLSYVPKLTPPKLALPDPAKLQRIEGPPADANGWAPSVLKRPHETDGQVISGKHFIQHGGSGMCITDMNGWHRDEKIRGCIFDFTDCSAGKWGLRDYGTQGTLETCIIQNVRKEHGRYTKLAAGVSIVRSVEFRNIGSQAYQQRVDDSPETAYADWSDNKLLRMEDVNCLECTTNKGDRPAFTISPKSLGPNGDFEGKDIFIQTVHGPAFQYGGHTYYSYGGMCFELCNTVRLSNVQIELRNARNEGIQFFDYGTPYEENGQKRTPRAPKDIEVRGGCMLGASISLRPQWHNKVKIHGVEGDGQIKLFTWQSGDWRMTGSVPIKQGYEQTAPAA